MILETLAVLGVLIGGAVVVANWDKITGWLREFIPKLRAAWKQVREHVPHAAKIVGDIVMEGADRLSRIMHKLYYQEDGQWMEETTTRKIDASEVPADIMAKIKRQQAQQQEANITEEMEEILQLEV